MPATRELFGQVAIRKGYCTPQDIDGAIRLQRELAKNGTRKLLGLILLERGLLGPKELIDILKEVRVIATTRTARRPRS